MEKALHRDVNYNWDGVIMRQLPDREHYVTRFLYDLLNQFTYTIEDVLYLKPEYFTECIEIRN